VSDHRYGRIVNHKGAPWACKRCQTIVDKPGDLDDEPCEPFTLADWEAADRWMAEWDRTHGG